MTPIIFVDERDTYDMRALVTHGCAIPPGKMVRNSLRVVDGQVKICPALALTQPCPSGQEPSRRTESSPVSPALQPSREEA